MKSGSTPPIVLVDGSSYLYRAFHAMPSLTNSKKFPTGAVYGLVNMVRKLINDVNPQFMAIIFDAKGKTFRDEIYPHYKAHRPMMPSELQQQIPPIHAIIQALGLPLLVIEGVEADDVIGTLAQQFSTEGYEVLISTGDKDLAQLVNPKVRLINTMTDTILTPETVPQKFGIPPERIVDYLALIGDTSDNIPGVPGVGPKTAVKWLNEFGSLENVIAHADQIKGKVGENFRAHLEQLPLARTLATIKLDVELNLRLNDLERKSPDKEALTELYQELEFKSWLKEILTEKIPESSAIQTGEQYKQETHHKNYPTIFTEQELQEWLKKLEQAAYFAFDTETTHIDYMEAELVGVSFAIASGDAAYLPFAHHYPDAPKQLSRDYVLQQLKPLLENKERKKICHNVKYDTEVLANHGIRLCGIIADTMLESYLLDNVGASHDLDSLALKYLGWKTITFEEVAGRGAHQITFDQVAIPEATTYAAEDADVTLRLHEKLFPRLESFSGLKNVFETIELPLIPVLARVERNGVLINVTKLHEQSREIEKRLAELEEQAFEFVGGTRFNLNSPKQLQEVLFDTLKLPVLQKTPKGQASTAEAVLQELALDYELPKLIIEHRTLSKLMSTYTNRLPEQINPRTGRVHTSYHQAVTTTGRLSSSDPNLQNIPIRTQEGRRIRQAFIAAPGHQLISADYSQIELRLMAHFSGDAGLLKAFKEDQDIHRATAAEVFGVPVDQVTNEQRRSAKAINFGIIYGISAFGLARQLGIDRQSAQIYIDRYFLRYPGIKNYMNETRALAHQQGFVETLLGRRVYVSEINSRQMQRQRAAERAAINGPLQGTAADIIKLAMINLDREIHTQKMNARMIMQVHDELVFEVAENEVNHVKEVIRQFMSQPVKLNVDLRVDLGWGNSWDEASSH